MMNNSWRSIDIPFLNVDIELYEKYYTGLHCKYCGQLQERHQVCNSCYTHKFGAVYAISRELIHNASNFLYFGDYRNGTDRIRGTKAPSGSMLTPMDYSLTEVLDRFPYELAKSTSYSSEDLHFEGEWFAHLTAYLAARGANRERHTPVQTVQTSEYHRIREEVLDFLKTHPKNMGLEHIRTIEQYYEIPDAEMDAKRVIFTMLSDLHDNDQLRVALYSRFKRSGNAAQRL